MRYSFMLLFLLCVFCTACTSQNRVVVKDDVTMRMQQVVDNRVTALSEAEEIMEKVSGGLYHYIVAGEVSLSLFNYLAVDWDGYGENKAFGVSCRGSDFKGDFTRIPDGVSVSMVSTDISGLSGIYALSEGVEELAYDLSNIQDKYFFNLYTSDVICVRRFILSNQLETQIASIDGERAVATAVFERSYMLVVTIDGGVVRNVVFSEQD